MQENLKVHCTQEKNNEADYSMSMRKSIIFPLNKRKKNKDSFIFKSKYFTPFISDLYFG